MDSVERGQIPAELNLGGEYSAKVLLPVLRHLARYWAAEPPQREDISAMPLKRALPFCRALTTALRYLR